MDGDRKTPMVAVADIAAAGVARTPETASPTRFEQWCAETLKPAFFAAVDAS
ncbi:hypothetical protein ABH935_000108 [Catenulispora sp. GAS73]